MTSHHTSDTRFRARLNDISLDIVNRAKLNDITPTSDTRLRARINYISFDIVNRATLNDITSDIRHQTHSSNK